MVEPIFEPMPGKVVVQEIKASEFLVDDPKSGVQIFAPSVGPQRRTTGVVVAVSEPWQQGEGEPMLETFLKVGDNVIFGPHSGVEVEYGRKKVIILREIEILTKVRVEKESDLQGVGVAAGANDDLP